MTTTIGVMKPRTMDDTICFHPNIDLCIQNREVHPDSMFCGYICSDLIHLKCHDIMFVFLGSHKSASLLPENIGASIIVCVGVVGRNITLPTPYLVNKSKVHHVIDCPPPWPKQRWFQSIKGVGLVRVAKAHGPSSVIDLNRTPIFDCCVISLMKYLSKSIYVYENGKF